MATTKFTKIVTSGVCEEVHEYDWIIENWELVQVDENLVKDQKFEILAGSKSSLLSKFTIGLEVSPADANGNRFIGIFCQLVELTGIRTELPISFDAHINNVKDGSPFWQPTPVSKSVKLNDICNHPNALPFNKSDNTNSDQYLVNGTLKVSIKLRALNPISVPESVTSSMEQFEKESQKLVETDFGNLFKANLNKHFDLTVISSDGLKFPCHKLILAARNPVFARILRTGQGLSETDKNAGVINIDDLSGKTIEVILNYLYTGKLLKTWNHPDVIVEFTYAAGKYNLSEVLKMLDNLLGNVQNDQTSRTSLLLLELANKLDLKNAQAKLMERIVKFAMKAENSVDLLALMENDKASKDSSSETEEIPMASGGGGTLPEKLTEEPEPEVPLA